MLGWLRAALNAGLTVYSLVKGKDEKPSLTEALPMVISNLLPMVQNAISFGGMNTKGKFDAFLDTIDSATGEDATAIDFIQDLPAEKEEQLFDHLKEAARIYGYSLIGVPGYKE